jgi:hypothetical protein|tara:strand:+ start:419 stop:1090 length:672 start_codon:yes stop_codon:yes gene_type:complete
VQESSVIVICGGPSLRHLPDLPELEEYIIVNDFDKEFEMESISKVLKGKSISQVMSRVYYEPLQMIKHGHYEEYKIKKIIQPYVSECVHGSCHCHLYRGSGKDLKFVGSKTEIPAELLGEHHKKYMITDGLHSNRYAHYYPTSGMAAFAYATLDMNKKNIYLIGMDFYDSNTYFNGDEARCHDRERQEMKTFLDKFTKQNKDKNFFICTDSSIKFNHKNVKKI